MKSRASHGVFKFVIEKSFELKNKIVFIRSSKGPQLQSSGLQYNWKACLNFLQFSNGLKVPFASTFWMFNSNFNPVGKESL